MSKADKHKDADSDKSDRGGDGDFVLDLDAVRKRAREQMSSGAVTAGYRGNREAVLRLLNDSLATELVCYLRYKRHQFMGANLGGIAGFAVSSEFARHALEEQTHADRLAERIVQLGGEPNFDPGQLLDRSHTEYVAGRNLQEIVESDLVAERIAVESYSAAIRYVGDKDATTRRLLEEILEQEEEHAEDMSDFLNRLRVNVGSQKS
jgi:bacterioferritin